MTNILIDRTDNIWFCKIGQGQVLVNGADHPMRVAVAEAYKRITGQEPDYIFSGWGGHLDEGERAVVENRQPVYEKTDYGQMQILKDRVTELEHALAEKDAHLASMALEAEQREEGHRFMMMAMRAECDALKTTIDNQARELERLRSEKADLVFKRDEIIEEAVTFAHWIVELTDTESDYNQDARAFLKEQAATALQQAKEER